MTLPADKCVWGCGNSNFNREHIIGKQVAQLLDIPYPAAIHWGDYANRQGETLEIVLPSRVCKTCNGGWMRKLDNLTMAFMRDGISEAAPVALRRNRQKRLAFWATKVGLLLQVWAHDECVKHPRLLEGKLPPTIPIFDMHALRSRQAPLDGTRIWVGLHEDPDSPPYFSKVSPLRVGNPNRPEGAHQHGYYVMFGVGRLVCFLVRWDGEGIDLLDALDPDRLTPGRMLRIWPTSNDTLQWPPPHHLVADDIGKITRTRPGWAKK